MSKPPNSSDALDQAIERLAVEFDIPLELLRGELHNLFVNRIAMAIAAELVMRRPVMCGIDNDLHFVFREVATAFHWEPKALFSAAVRLSYVQQRSIGLAALACGVAPVRKSVGLGQRAVESARDACEAEMRTESGGRLAKILDTIKGKRTATDKRKA